MKIFALALTMMMAMPAMANSTPTRSCTDELQRLSVFSELSGYHRERELQLRRTISHRQTTSSIRKLKEANLRYHNYRRVKENTELAFRNHCVAGNAQTCADSLQALISQSQQLGNLKAQRPASTHDSLVGTIAHHRSIVEGCMIIELPSPASSAGGTEQQVESEAGNAGRAN